MNETIYKIDESLIKRIPDDNKVAKDILAAYLDALAKNPANQTDHNFHKHFAVRLIRAIDNKPNIQSDLN
jgi:hypothetical protein